MLGQPPELNQSADSSLTGVVCAPQASELLVAPVLVRSNGRFEPRRAIIAHRSRRVGSKPMLGTQLSTDVRLRPEQLVENPFAAIEEVPRNAVVVGILILNGFDPPITQRQQPRLRIAHDNRRMSRDDEL
jgi:hypothetical protein